jgi:hypothetical protein
MRSRNIFAITVTVVLVALHSVQAQFITPVGISSSVPADAGSSTENVINGQGLDPATGNHFWGDHTFSYVTAAIPGFPAKYDFEAQRPTLILDLGIDTQIGMIHVWGYSGGSGAPMPQANSLKTFSLRFATDAEGPAGLGSSITYNPSFNLDPNNVPPGDSASGFIVPREDFAFDELLTVRWVEMSLLDNFWDDQMLFRGGDRVGFGEVRFAAIPEPSALALIGAGLLAAVFRVRRGCGT